MRYSSTLTVTNGSSINSNWLRYPVSAPVSLSPLSSWLIRQVAITLGDARSLRKRDFAILEHEGDAALARMSARSIKVQEKEEEAPLYFLLPR